MTTKNKVNGKTPKRSQAQKNYDQRKAAKAAKLAEHPAVKLFTTLEKAQQRRDNRKAKRVAVIEQMNALAGTTLHKAADLTGAIQLRLEF